MNNKFLTIVVSELPTPPQRSWQRLLSDFVVLVCGVLVHVVRHLSHIPACHVVVVVLEERLLDVEEELAVEVKEVYAKQCNICNCADTGKLK